MSTWLIEPRDPLLPRDGRPNDGRSSSATLPFPLPGTVAGVLRTRLGSDPARGFVLHDRLTELLGVSLRGPLLIDRGETQIDRALLVPAPRDALVTADAARGNERVLQPLRPLEGASLGGAAFDDGMATLLPVGVPEGEQIEGKPPRGVPQFWAWKSFERWLRGDERGRARGAAIDSWLEGSIDALTREVRLHVALSSDSGTYVDGALFQTSGLRFTAGRADALSSTRELALGVDVDTSSVAGRTLREGPGPFGGERRLVHWREARQLGLPAVPAWLRETVKTDDAVRLRAVLLTPAHFEGGHVPGASSTLLCQRAGVEARLVAAVTTRPETISGWDLKKRCPKPTRRLVGAGSVYWIELTGSAAAKVRWVDEVWMQNVSDSVQARRDGYGLVALGRSIE